MAGVSFNDYGSLFQNYRIPSIPDVRIGQVEKPMQQPEAMPIQTQEKTVITEEEPIRKQAGKSADLENISLKFNTGDDYGYIGRDSDIEQLDMQKAISDMKKDSVLQQYQYFVGSSQDLLTGSASEDGMVIPKFDL